MKCSMCKYNKKSRVKMPCSLCDGYKLWIPSETYYVIEAIKNNNKHTRRYKL